MAKALSDLRRDWRRWTAAERFMAAVIFVAASISPGMMAIVTAIQQ